MNPPTRAASVLALLLLASSAVAAPPGSVAFQKRVLTDKYYADGVYAVDINRDGKPDIIAGPFWYEGPGFEKAHAFFPPVVHDLAKSPTDSMFSYVHDFNGDGWIDILVLGRVHMHAAHWYENPGEAGLKTDALWKKHYAFERVRGESPHFADVDGDGKPELVAHWENRWGFITPNWAEPTKPWTFRPISEPWTGELNQFYHGTGVGDVNGDGRKDILLNDGWLEQPAAGDAAKPWPLRPFRFGTRGGAQMFAYDVDGDGDNDVLTSLDAHGWGLAWWEHVREPGGAITFKKHMLMDGRADEATYGVAFTQPHALTLADVDGDGLQDLIVGKRRWAHGPKGDVEPDADPVVYCFRLTRETPAKSGGAKFTPHRIDNASGVGVQIHAADVTGDGRVDVLTTSKLGTFLFLNVSALK